MRRIDRPLSAVSVSRGLNFGDYTEEEVADVMADPRAFVDRNLNRAQMGTHWTDPGTASEFATGEWSGEPVEGEGDPFGILMHGHVHERNIIDPESAERYAEHSNPLTRIDETIVRHGSRVHVNEVEFLHGPYSVGAVKGRWSGRA